MGASGNSEEVTVGGAYGEGVVVGGEVTNSGFSEVTHAIEDAIIKDAKEKIDQLKQTIDKAKKSD
ncbi:MAG: hypothetical protein LAO31_11290 [Acidobacteriia bacterium]|nr:hypothetical protein [Terriglobia bacterium]